MDNLKLLLSPDEIRQKVAEVARAIDSAYPGEELTLIVVMKGAICLTADLIRALKTPLSIETIKAKSYGHRGSKRGELTLEGLEELDLADKNVLLVDDIFDTGHTIDAILSALKKKHPKTLKTLVLLSKNILRDTSYLPDYILFHIENLFVIGYGLDYKEHYRGLPGIYHFKAEPK